MKWTNRGHELDQLAKQFIAVKRIYFWRTGKRAEECVNLLCWMKLDGEFEICFVDEDPEKRVAGFLGREVISPEEFFARYNEECLVVSTKRDISDRLREHGIPYHDFRNLQSRRNTFVQWFICIYMLYKHNKLVSHSMEYNVTRKCNLNCQGCLNFNHYICNPQDETLEAFKSHLFTVFQRYDKLFTFHLSGGEPFLNKMLPEMLHHITAEYSDKIYTKYIYTNGTVLANEELLKALKEGDFWVMIDDYRDTVPLARERIPQLIEKMEQYGIRYQLNKYDQWCDIAFKRVDFSGWSEEQMIDHRDRCNTYLQQMIDGKIYSCCYEHYAMVAGLVDHADCIDIMTTPKVEILEYRLGYTEKGYLDMCRFCHGLEDSAPLVPAVQIPKPECR